MVALPSSSAPSKLARPNCRLPGPVLLSSTLTLPWTWLAVTRSCCPSPFKSPTATKYGPMPTAIGDDPEVAAGGEPIVQETKHVPAVVAFVFHGRQPIGALLQSVQAHCG